jgi:hypothetical protein
LAISDGVLLSAVLVTAEELVVDVRSTALVGDKLLKVLRLETLTGFLDSFGPSRHCFGTARIGLEGVNVPKCCTGQGRQTQAPRQPPPVRIPKSWHGADDERRQVRPDDSAKSAVFSNCCELLRRRSVWMLTPAPSVSGGPSREGRTPVRRPSLSLRGDFHTPRDTAQPRPNPQRSGEHVAARTRESRGAGVGEGSGAEPTSLKSRLWEPPLRTPVCERTPKGTCEARKIANPHIHDKCFPGIQTS